MSSTLIIGLIAGIIVISLVASGISYSRQQAMKRRKTQIAKLRQQADEALAFITLLLKIDEKYIVILQLQSLAVSSLKKAFELAPEDPLITNNLAIQQDRLNSYKAGQRSNKVKCYMRNDTELGQAQSQLGQIGKLIDIFRNKGLIPSANATTLHEHLQHLKEELNINSNLYQADCFAEDGDLTMYQMHIKQALDSIKRSSLDNDTKNKRIKELSDVLSEIRRTNRILEDKTFIKPKKKKPTNTPEDSETATDNNDNSNEKDCDATTAD